MGKPAARIGDMHVCPMFDGLKPHVGGPVTGPGVPTVLIGGMPAAVMGDMCTCASAPDTIILGSTGVLIGGKPAARMGDQCAHGGTIILGCLTVLIGETMAGGGGGGFSAPSASAVMNARDSLPPAMKSQAAQMVSMKEAAISGKPFVHDSASCSDCITETKPAKDQTQKNGAPLFKKNRTAHIGDRNFPLSGGKAAINSNKTFLITPDKNLLGQKKNDTCAIVSMAMAINQVAGTNLTESEVIAESQKHAGGYSAGKGTFTNNIKPTVDGLKISGVKSSSQFLTDNSQLFKALDGGNNKAAVVHVNNENYFGGTGGHFVTVKGVSIDSSGNKFYEINDPWGEPPPEPAGNGKSLKVPASDFENSMSGYVTVVEGENPKPKTNK